MHVVPGNTEELVTSSLDMQSVQRTGYSMEKSDVMLFILKVAMHYLGDGFPRMVVSSLRGALFLLARCVPMDIVTHISKARSSTHTA